MTSSLASVAVNLCSALASEANSNSTKPVQDLWTDNIYEQNDTILNLSQAMEEANNAIAAALQEEEPVNIESTSSTTTQEDDSIPRTSTVSPVTPLSQDDPSSAASSTPSSPTCTDNSKKRKIHQDEGRRQERNAREKARSNKISSQFDDLKEILIRAGVAVPRSTKGSILDSAMAYIKALQVHAHQSELERQRLQQQLQEGVTSRPVQESTAAAVEAIPTMPHSTSVQQGMSSLLEVPSHPPLLHPLPIGSSLTRSCYKDAFEHCAIGMAIANVEGTLVHGNRLFCQLLGRAPHEIPRLTVFNVTAKEHLTLAFERLGGWLAETTHYPQEEEGREESFIHLNAALPHMELHITKIDNADPTRLEVDCQRHRLLITLVPASVRVPAPGDMNPPSQVPSTVQSCPDQTIPHKVVEHDHPCQPMETTSSASGEATRESGPRN